MAFPFGARRSAMVAALVASFSLLAVPGFATPGRAAGDNINLVQALRTGGLAKNI